MLDSALRTGQHTELGPGVARIDPPSSDEPQNAQRRGGLGTGAPEAPKTPAPTRPRSLTRSPSDVTGLQPSRVPDDGAEERKQLAFLSVPLRLGARTLRVLGPVPPHATAALAPASDAVGVGRLRSERGAG